MRVAGEHAAGTVLGQRLVAAHDDQASRSGPELAVRGSGTPTKFRPVGGWPGEAPVGGGGGGGGVRGANLVGGLEPTAYNAGAGAPAPTGVIRGLRQTYATDTGGPQLEEHGTVLQARQASYRFEKGKNLVAIENLPPEAQAGIKGGIGSLLPRLKFTGEPGVLIFREECLNKNSKIKIKFLLLD